MKPLAFLLALIAVLGALFVLFKPSASTAPATAPNTAASTPSSNAPVVPGEAKPAVVAEPSAVAMARSQPQASASKTFALVVRSGRLASGSPVIQVREGDRVRLELTTDTADELHIHGYDLHVKTQPGEMASLDFVAKRTGRFALELHRAGLELGALEVYPR